MREALVNLLLCGSVAGLAACGSVASNEADAGTSIDGSTVDGTVATPDAQVIDAMTHGMVTVVVFVGDAPAENVAVMYHEADGSYIGSELTDANGEVVIDDMPVGGAITAPVSPFGAAMSGPVLTSVAGVQIGDVITLGKSESTETLNAGNRIGSVSVTMPPALAGANRYEAHMACTDSSTSTEAATLNVVLGDRCPPSGSVSVVAYAEDTTANNRLGYSIQPSVPITGTAPELTGSTTMPAWSSDLGLYTVDVTDAPAAALEVDAFLAGFRGGVLHEQFNLDDLVLADMGDGGAFTAKVAPNYSDELLFALAVQLGDNGNTTSLFSVRDDSTPVLGSPVNKTLNLSTELPGAIEGVANSAESPFFVGWTADNFACKDESEPDAILTALRAADANDNQYMWFLLSPGDTQPNVNFPQLDAAVAQTLWPEAVFTDVQGGVLFKGHSAITYDDWRNSEANLGTFDYIYDQAGTFCMSAFGLLNLSRR